MEREQQALSVPPGGDDEAVMWRVPHLHDLKLMRAVFVEHTFTRHAHDYFVFGLIETGLQTFSYRHQQHYTPPGHLIALNPGEPHDGESASTTGFTYRAMYPEVALMQQLVAELTEGKADIPFFQSAVIDDPALYYAMRGLHHLVETEASALEFEEAFYATMARLIARHADAKFRAAPLRESRRDVKRVQRYMDAHYAENITLARLSEVACMSAYHLVRTFKQEVGLAPHRYLTNTRIKHAQALLLDGMTPADVAFATGFSSQSHLTTTFRRYIGITPAKYAQSEQVY